MSKYKYENAESNTRATQPADHNQSADAQNTSQNADAQNNHQSADAQKDVKQLSIPSFLGQSNAEPAAQGISSDAAALSLPAEGLPSTSLKDRLHGLPLKWMIVFAVIAVLAVLYLWYGSRYRTRFLPNTSVNGTDVGGLTAAEYESTVADQLTSYTLTVTFPNGNEEVVTASDIDLAFSSDGSVDAYLSRQNTLTWIAGIFGYTREVSYIPGVTYDYQKLLAVMGRWPELDEESRVEPSDAYLDFDETGHLVIVPEVEGNALDIELLKSSLRNSIVKTQASLDISSVEGLELKPTVYSDDTALNECMEDLNGFLDTTVTWTLSDGSAHTLDASETHNWLIHMNDGTYEITDQTIANKAGAYIASLASEDDNYGTSRTFYTTNYGAIRLETESIHGHALDQPAMASALADALTSRTSAELDLIYGQYEDSGLATDSGTYLEVDIDNQTVYYYLNGELVNYWPVVTGLVGSHSTPYGIYKLERKIKDTVLEGPIKNGKPSYSAHVEYFNQFFPSYGFHDASWRSGSEFGGDTYLYDGSHGCINMPLEGAEYIYEQVDTGTPVIVFSNSNLDSTVLRYHEAADYTAECQTHDDINSGYYSYEDDDDVLNADES